MRSVSANSPCCRSLCFSCEGSCVINIHSIVVRTQDETVLAFGSPNDLTSLFRPWHEQVGNRPSGLQQSHLERAPEPWFANLIYPKDSGRDRTACLLKIAPVLSEPPEEVKASKVSLLCGCRNGAEERKRCNNNKKKISEEVLWGDGAWPMNRSNCNSQQHPGLDQH